eukprot:6700831-Lingulodinium_polyedra.AAC.1
MDMSEIVSAKSKTFWPTYSADSFSKLPAAALLFQHCALTEEWGKAHKAWLCTLLEPGLLFRRVGASKWHFSMGHVQGCYLSCL